MSSVAPVYVNAESVLPPDIVKKLSKSEGRRVVLVHVYEPKRPSQWERQAPRSLVSLVRSHLASHEGAAVQLYIPRHRGTRRHLICALLEAGHGGQAVADALGCTYESVRQSATLDGFRFPLPAKLVPDRMKALGLGIKLMRERGLFGRKVVTLDGASRETGMTLAYINRCERGIASNPEDYFMRLLASRRKRLKSQRSITFLKERLIRAGGAIRDLVNLKTPGGRRAAC